MSSYNQPDPKNQAGSDITPSQELSAVIRLFEREAKYIQDLFDDDEPSNWVYDSKGDLSTDFLNRIKLISDSLRELRKFLQNSSNKTRDVNTKEKIKQCLDEVSKTRNVLSAMSGNFLKSDSNHIAFGYLETIPNQV